MKTIKLLFPMLLTFTLCISSVFAQNDTMYIMKSGVIVGRYNVNTQIDSIIFYNPMRGTFIDERDGNVYKWVKIGNQIWMAENLRYLPSIVGPSTGSSSVPYYYVYGYDGTDVSAAKATENYTTYGVLYNWPAVMAGASSSLDNPSGVRGVCPTGWHLPSDAEWKELIDYLGGDNIAGGKLKEAGTTHWSSPNAGATNEAGFTALPGGHRKIDGVFQGIGISCFWWSTSGYNIVNSWNRSLVNHDVIVYRGYSNNELGFSVRCLKD